MTRWLYPALLIFTGLALLAFLLVVQGKKSRRLPPFFSYRDRVRQAPSISETLSLFESKFPEFTSLLNLFLQEVPMEELLRHKEIAGALSKLSFLVEKSEKSRAGGSIIITDLRLPAQEMRAAKATMVTIVRGLHDFEQAKERLGADFQKLEERFLESLQ